MSRYQRVIQGSLVCVFACACLLTLTSQGTTATHAANAVKAATSSCVAPPANFDPLTATKSELDLYGLPPKPTDQKDLQSWAQMISTAKSRSCGATIARPNLYSKPNAAKITGTKKTASVTPSFSTTSWYTWAGYATGWGYGLGFDEAYGNWNLPCVSAPDATGYHSITWVGLGGWYNNEHLLQAGTINDPTWGLSLWWEAWPSNAIQVIPGIHPHCGDKIFSDVWVNYNTGTSYYYVADVSQNAYASNRYNNFVPDRQSAEWIDERPSCASGNYTPLANFNYTNFYNSRAEVTGASTYGTISTYHAGSIRMVSSNGATIAAPGGLNAAGDSFQDRWYGTGSGQLC